MIQQSSYRQSAPTAETTATIQLPSISSLLSDIYNPPATTPIATVYSKPAIQDVHSKSYPILISNPIHAFSNTISCTAIPTGQSTTNIFSSTSSLPSSSTTINQYSSTSPVMVMQHHNKPISHSSQSTVSTSHVNRYSSLFSVYSTHQAPQQPYRENSIWESTVNKQPIFFTKVDQSNSPAKTNRTNQTITTCAVPIACKTIASQIPIRNTLTVPNSNVLMDESGFSHSSNVSIIGTDVKSNNSSSSNSQFNDHHSSGVSSETTCSSSNSGQQTNQVKKVITASTSPNVEVLKKVASACIKRGKESTDSDEDDEQEDNIPNNYSKQKIGKLRLKSSVKGDLAAKNKNGSHKGWWTEEEHQRFLEGLEACGNNWKLIAEKYVKTRSRTQVASHGQKWKQSQGLIA